MAVNYTFDADLDTVIQAASNEDLGVLVAFFKQADEYDRISESEEFLRFYPDHKRYGHVISKEIRTCGGHSIANFFRGGKGPDYHTVVCDVAKHMDVAFDEEDSVVVIERKILAHVLKDMYGNFSEEQKQLFVNEIKQHQPNMDSKSLVAAVEQGELKDFNNKAMILISSVLSLAIAKLMGITTLASNLSDSLSTSVTKIVTMLNGPISYLGNILNAIVDLGGPTYRLTVPCVIHIAMLRTKQSDMLLTCAKTTTEQLAAPKEDSAESTDSSAEEKYAEAQDNNTDQSQN